MLPADQIRGLLKPFAVHLDDEQLRRLRIYLELLMKWNKAINLTAIRDERECVVRHFGESLFLASRVRLQGSLLDVGSGAGFPGLALKIPFPNLSVTLLEPVAKKRAFLKEVLRACSMDSVDVCADRLENLSLACKVDATTIRAVGDIEKMSLQLVRHLKPEGRVYFWTTAMGASKRISQSGEIQWIYRLSVPDSRHREIWVGSPHEDSKS
jgi:16S rRNA (guanine527-N7)-methyltransferase